MSLKKNNLKSNDHRVIEKLTQQQQQQQQQQQHKHLRYVSKMTGPKFKKNNMNMF